MGPTTNEIYRTAGPLFGANQQLALKWRQVSLPSLWLEGLYDQDRVSMLIDIDPIISAGTNWKSGIIDAEFNTKLGMKLGKNSTIKNRDNKFKQIGR